MGRVAKTSIRVLSSMAELSAVNRTVPSSNLGVPL